MDESSGAWQLRDRVASFLARELAYRLRELDYSGGYNVELGLPEGDSLLVFRAERDTETRATR